MGSMQESSSDEDEKEEVELTGEDWNYGWGEGTWQSRLPGLRQRVAHLQGRREMSDLGLLVSDENWWFGDTVKDFNAHKFVMATVSPVLHKILYELNEENNPDKRLILDRKLNVRLNLVQCYDYIRLDIDGIPPIVVEALLDYAYKDKFDEKDFENGYSRNLLWRLWHAAKALEMEHLGDLCTKTLHKTLCEDTVFWDLNYAMQFVELGTAEIMDKVLKLTDSMHDALFEHPNFVWLEKEALWELLKRRGPNTCDALTVYNNLLKWTLYQIDRTACRDHDDAGNKVEVSIRDRLDWITQGQNGSIESVSAADVAKYLKRGVEHMPWRELSQKDFVDYVVPYKVMSEQDLLSQSTKLMSLVVEAPGRLHKSAFKEALQRAAQDNAAKMASRGNSRNNSATNSPVTPRRGLSRSNSLRKSVQDVRLRPIQRGGGGTAKGSSRPTSLVM